MELRTLLHENCISIDLPLENKQDVFRLCADELFDSGVIDNQEDFVEALNDRETLSETGLEDGIAISHGISPCVRQAAIAYIRLSEPIEWESMDGTPVRPIFLLAIPQDGGKVHIRLLSELALKLMHQDVKNGLNRVKTREELYQIL